MQIGSRVGEGCGVNFGLSRLLQHWLLTQRSALPCIRVTITRGEPLLQLRVTCTTFNPISGFLALYVLE